MKTTYTLRVAAVSISAALALAHVGQAEKPNAMPQQDPGQQEKRGVDLTLALPRAEGPGEGQEAQQKVMLELVAADAQVVKSKPYSADTSTETVQTLPDGNRIVHRTVSKFYRDTDGRTRREQTFGNVDPEHPTPHEVKIFIDDPISSTAYVLDPGSKSAEKMQRAHVTLDGRGSDDDGTRMMVKSLNDTESAEQGAPRKIFFNIRDDHSSSPNDVVIQIADENRDVVKEDLGTRNIEGVDCTGTRKTSTIPAGAVGNEKPISIVTETWYAPALAAVVESTTDDPRFGKTTYKLANVQLSEPPHSLFEPPASYKINTRK